MIEEAAENVERPSTTRSMLQVAALGTIGAWWAPSSGLTRVMSHAAQHDSFATSLSNVCAASFRPSAFVRYG